MQAENIKEDPLERLKKFQSTKPIIEPASTKKWQSNIEKSVELLLLYWNE